MTSETKAVLLEVLRGIQQDIGLEAQDMAALLHITPANFSQWLAADTVRANQEQSFEIIRNVISIYDLLSSFLSSILDKKDLNSSWEFRRAHIKAPAIAYQSVRDPKKGTNYAIFEKSNTDTNTTQDWDVEIEISPEQAFFRPLITPISLPKKIEWTVVS